jgi:hypothetical protein
VVSMAALDRHGTLRNGLSKLILDSYLSKGRETASFRAVLAFCSNTSCDSDGALRLSSLRIGAMGLPRPVQSGQTYFETSSHQAKSA